MTRKARNPVMYSDLGAHYVAEPAVYHPDPNPRSYHIIPERYPRIRGRGTPRRSSGIPYPDGLVDIRGITGPQVRRLSYGYLDTRLGGASVADRQRYICRIIENPRSPRANVDTAVAYVRDNPRMFIPGSVSPMYSDDVNRIIGIRNGDSPDPDFVGRIRSMFPGVWRR
jgi:hypothetical protein